MSAENQVAGHCPDRAFRDVWGGARNTLEPGRGALRPRSLFTADFGTDLAFCRTSLLRRVKEILSRLPKLPAAGARTTAALDGAGKVDGAAYTKRILLSTESAYESAAAASIYSQATMKRLIRG